MQSSHKKVDHDNYYYSDKDKLMWCDAGDCIFVGSFRDEDAASNASDALNFLYSSLSISDLIDKLTVRDKELIKLKEEKEELKKQVSILLESLDRFRDYYELQEN